MKMIVGLGNPGCEYDNTRHNMGFMFIDYYAKHLGVSIDKVKFNALYACVCLNGEKLLLVKPQSFINLSGEVVKKFVSYFKIDISDVLIISDDLDQPFGCFKLKKKGSSGGHNGLKNIELHLGTQEYKRLKLGISNNKMVDTKDYVLGKLSSNDMEKLEKMSLVVNNILDDFLSIDFDRVMNKYNGS